jgi:hypothetical protein
MLMATTPLDERIVAALKNECTSAEVATIRADAEEELARIGAEANSIEAATLSPLATNAQAQSLRAKATDLRFDADRLEASVGGLTVRIAELKDAEWRRTSEEKRQAALADRDALAAEIAQEYPRVVAWLTGIVKRIHLSGLGDSAEAIGRGVPANFVASDGGVMRLGDIQLPLPDSAHLAWGPTWDGGMQWRGLAGKGTD